MMFEFGNPDNIKQVYVDNILAEPGPNIPKIHHTKMTLSDLRNLFAYLYGALSRIIKDNSSPEVVNSMYFDYDLVFEHLASRDPKFRLAVREGRHIFHSYESEYIKKYQDIVSKYE